MLHRKVKSPHIFKLLGYRHNIIVNQASVANKCQDKRLTSAEITFPRADSERLILIACLKVSSYTNKYIITHIRTQHSIVPTLEPVFDCLSLPARSTRFSLPTLMWSCPSGPLWWEEGHGGQTTHTLHALTAQHSTVTMKIAWDLDEVLFMSVHL